VDGQSFRDWRVWRNGVLVGAVVGAVVLGVGGRMVMRAIAQVTEQGVYFTLRGSMTVVGAGAAFGAVGGTLLVLSQWLFPDRRLLRWLSFWTACLLITLHVVSPVNAVRLSFFLPLLAVYLVSLHLASKRGRRVPGRFQS
jgi:hypothetical protein